MAASAKALLIPWLLAAAALPETFVTPEQASARKPGNYAPVRLDETVTVKGRVGVGAIDMMDQYWHVGIEDGGYGLVLEASGDGHQIRSLEPGDMVVAKGRIGARGGLPVLLVQSVSRTGSIAAPEPADVPVQDLLGFTYLGRLVTTQGRVVEVGENTAGAYMLIGDERRPYKIFVPHSRNMPAPSLSAYAVGDVVRATGLASQYCPKEPFNRWFQLTVAGPGQVVRLQRRWPVNPAIMLLSITAALVFGFALWNRERRLRAQRETLRRAHQLGEEILGAASAEEIQHKIGAVLPQIFGISDAHLYVHNLGASALDEVTAAPDTPGSSVPLNGTAAGLQAAGAACFHNRTLLAIADSARSPFPDEEPGGPRAALLVPMLARGDSVGVLRIDQHDRVREFTQDEQALAQHLANQIGVALKLLDQRMVREQLFRTEKLAAVGRLISGVVNELRAPLSSISQRAEAVVRDPRSLADPAQREREAQAIFSEARKATQIVSRLVGFASTEPVEAKPVDLNGIVRSLVEFRDREWASRGIRTRSTPSERPLLVIGSQGQLEQVVLDLLVFAEQELAGAGEKGIMVRTSRLGRKALVEIAYSGPRGGPDPLARVENASALGLGVCRSVIAGHGGELRFLTSPQNDPRFEIELPLAGRNRLSGNGHARAHAPGQILTALVIEPDEAAQQQLLGMLTSRGFRVVPVRNSDVGLDMAQRIRFDAAFCSVHAPGLNWVELSEQLQQRVGAFVLLSDGYDTELAADFEGEGRFVLPKPVDEAQLDHLAGDIERLARSMA